MDNPNTSYFVEDKEINVLEIILKISREWKIVSLIASSFFVVSSIHVIQQKRVWEGQFQILLPDAGSSALEGLNSMPIKALVGNGNIYNDKNLTTKVEVLKSPSVLLPVFELIKEKCH